MSRHVTRRRFLSGTGGACATALAVGASERASGANEPDGTERSANLDGLEAFVDETVRSHLDDHDIAGAAVSVVRDGAVALTKGYGHAFLDENDPVVADETRFRIGSVSKAITWTAAMQLVDRGEIDPHEDVTTYLESVSIPDTYDEPITLADLATHTAGFEVRARGDKVADIDRLRPLDEAVAEYRPARVRPPGETPQYTNYAAALAGQLVADVADTTFEKYVAENVFDPLGMDRSTFEQAPGGFGADSSEAFTDEVNWYSDVPPASGMSATAADMARFLLAHMNRGAADSGRVLSPEATDEMHRQWFTPHERLDGFAFGLFERSRGDVRILRHGGGVPQFATELLLVPELDIGLFVTYSGAESGTGRSAFVDSFLDRYVPVEAEKPAGPDGRPARADDIEGSYRSILVTDAETYEKPVLAAFGSMRTIDVRIEDDGTLVTDDGDGTERWVEVEPLVFRRTDGRETLAFREEDGTLTHLFVEQSAFEPISLHDRIGFQTKLAAVTALVMLSGVVGWPLGSARRWYRDGPSLSGGARRARWVGGGAAVWPLGFVLGVVVLFVIAGNGVFDQPPSGFRVVFGLPVAGAVATLWAGAYAVRSWRRGYWSRLARVHYTAVVCASVGLLWVFHYWNLLGV